MSSDLTKNLTQPEIYQRLQVDSEKLKQFCQSNLIAELAVFGSILRDDFSSNSDVDVLITYLPDAPRGLLEKVQLKDKFENRFRRPVELISKTSIENSYNWIKRSSILNSCEVLYRA